MLVKSIETIIIKTIREYNSKLSEKYSLDINDLEELWNEVAGDASVVKKSGGKTKKTETDSDSVDTKVSKKSNKEGGCPYLFTKGKNEGSTCGSKPKDGGEYCSRHQKFEGVGQTEKKKIPEPKKSVVSQEKKKETPVNKSKPQIVIRLNKDINKYWNPETTLVFKSKDERVVIGSFKEDKLHSLTEDDINTCDKYGFKYEEKEVIEEKPVEKKPTEDKVVEKKVVEKKKMEEKVVAQPKKSLSAEITKTNLQAESIEKVLSEICKDEDDDYELEDIVEDEQDKEDKEDEDYEPEEEEEEEEEEELEEEDD